jgi:hypothetical protein
MPGKNPIAYCLFPIASLIRNPQYAIRLCLLLLTAILGGCQVVTADLPIPTLAPAAPTITRTVLAAMPVTWTPAPFTPVPTLTLPKLQPNEEPTPTGTIPTSTPVPPTPTPTATPTVGPSPTITVMPLSHYSLSEPLPIEVYPRPRGDNGWGMHWIPTVSQDRGTVDRFVAELVQMHIRWVVFLNDDTNIGNNDYLVERLVANGIMPVMRVFRSTITPHDGDLGRMVAHYRAKGVYYFQLYNEPNVNDENHQSFANPNLYATVWADAAREVIANGGFPGIGAFSPGGSYDHYTFLDRTLRILEYNGDAGLLNRAWLSVHNYHGLRPQNDPHGFLLFRNYDEIVRNHLHRSLPMIGTEGGSYSPDPQVEKQYITFQYRYMRDAEPYFFAFSYWLLANQAGGAFDPSWEWQALFRHDFVHPAVTDFFYRNSS